MLKFHVDAHGYLSVEGGNGELVSLALGYGIQDGKMLSPYSNRYVSIPTWAKRVSARTGISESELVSACHTAYSRRHGKYAAAYVGTFFTAVHRRCENQALVAVASLFRGIMSAHYLGNMSSTKYARLYTKRLHNSSMPVGHNYLVPVLNPMTEMEAGNAVSLQKDTAIWVSGVTGFVSVGVDTDKYHPLSDDYTNYVNQATDQNKYK